MVRLDVQLKMIEQEYGIAHENLQANANLQRQIDGAEEINSIINEIQTYEQSKNSGPIQTQFFG